jgi:hypothetical protein
MPGSFYIGLYRRELPDAREREVLDAIDAIARPFSLYVGHEVGGVRDVEYKAVQVYLMRRALNWGYSRIGRRLGGVSRVHAIHLAGRGKAIVARAVACGAITPRAVADLLPARTFL